MLDKKVQKLLKFLNKETTENSYKVIDKSDFFKAFSKKKKKINDNALANMIKVLDKHNLVSIKYSDDQVYCLTSTNRGRNYFEDELNQAKEIYKLKKTFFFYTILAGLASFAGTLTALYIFFR